MISKLLQSGLSSNYRNENKKAKTKTKVVLQNYMFSIE